MLLTGEIPPSAVNLQPISESPFSMVPIIALAVVIVAFSYIPSSFSKRLMVATPTFALSAKSFVDQPSTPRAPLINLPDIFSISILIPFVIVLLAIESTKSTYLIDLFQICVYYPLMPLNTEQIGIKKGFQVAET